MKAGIRLLRVGEADARHVARGHGPLRLARRRRRGRRLGLYERGRAPSRTGPDGLCLCFPARGAVAGRLVMAPGDVNLTFKRYLESPIELTIRDDYVVDIAGARARRRADAQLLRRVGRPRRVRGEPRGLGHESGRALGRHDHVRPERLQRHRAPRVRGELPLLDRRQRGGGSAHAGPLRPAAAPLHGAPRRHRRRRRTACSRATLA